MIRGAGFGWRRRRVAIVSKRCFADDCRYAVSLAQLPSSLTCFLEASAPVGATNVATRRRTMALSARATLSLTADYRSRHES